MATVKQVIVMRKDLKMRRGKEIAQGSHASLAFLTRKLKDVAFGEVADGVWKKILLSLAEIDWLDEKFTKVCVRVNSEQELKDIYDAALYAGLTVHMVVDAGATEFHGVATPTCCAIGPDDAEKIDAITGKLELY